MDSVTQIALGAAVGEATLGRQVGRRALFWGGVCGLFPDLDILIPFGDAVKNFTYHRGASHSLFVLAILTPLFVHLILRVHPSTAVYRLRWVALVYLAFATHVLLDCLTVYGTQIFWPLPTPPIMWSTIFIIDPAYSLPLFAGVLAAAILSRQTFRGHVVNTVCLVLSTSYLLWSVGAKIHVEAVAARALHSQNIAHNRVLTVPSPFNTLLWRVLVMDDRGYYEGYYSLLDLDTGIPFQHFPSRNELLEEVADHWPVKRLQWFTHGYYSVRLWRDRVVMTDLRMGMEPSYVFAFAVASLDNPHAQPLHPERLAMVYRPDRLAWVWQRIWRPLQTWAGAGPLLLKRKETI